VEIIKILLLLALYKPSEQQNRSQEAQRRFCASLNEKYLRVPRRRKITARPREHAGNTTFTVEAWSPDH